ncbi:hypothetical protein TNCV_2969881 [Trichonephila clavipes]|nr:hypothetical protein TNCV_2969881 [Trichonephila clavipes]
MPDDSILSEPWQALTLKSLECAKCSPGVFMGGEQESELGLKKLQQLCRIVLDDDSTARLFRAELAEAGVPKVGTSCTSGWGTRIGIRISEPPLIFLDTAEMRSNRFAFESRVRIFIPYNY